MLRGVTQAGIGAIESPERMIDLASEAGFQAVDFSAKELIDRLGTAGAREKLAKHGNFYFSTRKDCRLVI